MEIAQDEFFRDLKSFAKKHWRESNQGFLSPRGFCWYQKTAT
jgi:hypothetical protein